MNYKVKGRLPVETYVKGILDGNKVILSKAITLMESSLPEDQLLSNEVLEKVFPHTGKSFRIGITGVPGVGKSTFIESFGKLIVSENIKLAVLAIDPSSQKTRGSIMGDKTRMESLAQNPKAFIRPSPTGNTLGGVAGRSRETILLCEAAGYEIIIVETVGVGQSETAVHGMVDFFLLLMLAGAGDELQGIKRGIMEMADAVVITKADGDNLKSANIARSVYENALHLYPASNSGWICKVLTCSAIEQKGMEAVWKLVREYRSMMRGNGYLEEKRRQQNLRWLHENILSKLEKTFYANPDIKVRLTDLQKQVLKGETSATKAALELWEIYRKTS